MGSKEVTIIRHQYRYRFPADFQLIVAFNPCPCGYHGFEDHRVHCRCTPYAINSYLNKLSGPILDRIDMYLQVPYMDHSEWGSNKQRVQNEQSKQVRLRVEQGIAFKALRRGKGEEHQDTYAYLEASCTADARRLFLKGIEKGLLRPRHLTKLLQIARTIADLEQSEHIQKSHIAEAIQLRKFNLTLEK